MYWFHPTRVDRERSSKLRQSMFMVRLRFISAYIRSISLCQIVGCLHRWMYPTVVGCEDVDRQSKDQIQSVNALETVLRCIPSRPPAEAGLDRNCTPRLIVHNQPCGATVWWRAAVVRPPTHCVGPKPGAAPGWSLGNMIEDSFPIILIQPFINNGLGEHAK